MVPLNIKHQPSMIKARENAQNRHGDAPRKSVEPVDHWAFLDEIEAPMWVDLNFESKYGYNDSDHEWFQRSHLFHQCSSQQLISKSSHLGEFNSNGDFGTKDPSFSKLQQSVSRTRGKNYKSREWGQRNCNAKSSKPNHIKSLSSNSSQPNSGSGLKMKSKNPKGNTRSRADSVARSSLADASLSNYLKSSSSIEGSKTIVSSAPSKEVKNTSSSTVTSESSEQQHQKSLEVPGQVIGRSSGLFSALKFTLRKSCVTRQALRGEIISERNSEGCKSSSGQSSVGSTSHQASDVKDLIHPGASQKRDLTPDSRDVMKIPQITNQKIKESHSSKESTAESVFKIPNHRKGTKTNSTKLAYEEAAKSKVNWDLHSKAMRTHRANQSVTAAIEAHNKVGVSGNNRLGTGKENLVCSLTMSERSNIRAGDMVEVQKAVNQIAPQKSDRKELASQKGKTSGQGNSRYLKTVNRKVPFR